MGELKQTTNKSKFIGVLSEKALTVESGKMKDDKGKEFDCAVIKGTISIETANGTFPLRVYSKSKKKDRTDNKMYAGLVTIMHDYVSKFEISNKTISFKENGRDVKIPIVANEKDADTDSEFVIANTADTIECVVKVDINDYVSKNSGKVVSGVQLGMNKANRVAADTESTTDLMLEGYIGKIAPETDKDGEETGRLIVTLVTIGYGGVAKPFTIIVPEDLADDFVDMYEEGQTAMLYCAVMMRHVGGSSNTTAAFGKRAKVSSGFDVQEIVLIGGDEPYEDDENEEGNSKCISAKDIKALMKERKLMLEQKEKDAQEEASKPKETKTKKGLGSIKKIENPVEDDDDCPFGEEEDSLF